MSCGARVGLTLANRHMGFSIAVFTGEGCVMCKGAAFIARRVAAASARRIAFQHIDLGAALSHTVPQELDRGAGTGVAADGGEHGGAFGDGMEAWRQEYRNSVPVIALFRTETGTGGGDGAQPMPHQTQQQAQQTRTPQQTRTQPQTQQLDAHSMVVAVPGTRHCAILFEPEMKAPGETTKPTEALIRERLAVALLAEELLTETLLAESSSVPPK